MPNPNNNKKSTTKNENRTGSNYQSFGSFKTSGALLGGNPKASVVSPVLTLTKKVGAFFGNLFKRRPKASERPGVVKPVAVSNLTSSGIAPIKSAKAPSLSNINLTPKVNPSAQRSKSTWEGWRPTSFASIVGGFSGIKNIKGTVQTGVFANTRFETFKTTGPTTLRQIKPGQNITSTGWDRIAGWGIIHQGDSKGYSIRKNRDWEGSSQASIFKHLVKSQTGTGYMGSSNLFKYGTTGGIGSTSHGRKRFSDVASGKKLLIRNYNAPQFLHQTLKSISDAVGSGSKSYTVSTSEGQRKKPTESHALSLDFEVYKSYMDKYFSSAGLRKGYTTEKPSIQKNVFSSWYRSGGGVDERNYSNIMKSYGKRTKSGEIPTISQYSMEKVGYDILKPPGR